MTGPHLRSELTGVPARVYVPDSGAATLTVIDPSTFEIVGRQQVGDVPHHVTPSWDMTTLYVNNTEGNSLTVINPSTAATEATIALPDPYNLYFTPDGTKAVVVAERLKRLDFRNPNSWELIRSVPITRAGVDHGDFSADGRYFVASCEFSGYVVKVDTQLMEVVAETHVGGAPIDVKLSPDGSVFYVTNQVRHGVSVLDAGSLAEVGFLATGRGAHGLNVSRDAKVLFVSNRLEGSVSVIDMNTRQLLATWNVGGSPDMLQVSPDGRQLWFSNRFHGSVSVVDTASGSVIRTIATGAGAHGLSFFPQPGRFSIGHNGVYR